MKVKYMTNKTRFKPCDHMIYIYSIPSKFILPSPLKAKYITSPNETLMCVCADLTSLTYTYYKLKRGNRFLCVQIVTNLLLPNYIILYMRAPHVSSISVDCTNILPSISIYLDKNAIGKRKHYRL